MILRVANFHGWGIIPNFCQLDVLEVTSLRFFCVFFRPWDENHLVRARVVFLIVFQPWKIHQAKSPCSKKNRKFMKFMIIVHLHDQVFL